MFTNVEEGNSFSSPGSSIHAVFQARILEWLVIPVSWGSSWCRGQTHFCIAGRFFTIWATREALLMQRPTQWQCFRISGYFICYFIRSENCNASPISCSVYVRIIPSFIKHVAESHLKNLKLIFLLFCPVWSKTLFWCPPWRNGRLGPCYMGWCRFQEQITLCLSASSLQAPCRLFASSSFSNTTTGGIKTSACGPS